jgi:glycosyltransferase involved in cell wall biosynthesis
MKNYTISIAMTAYNGEKYIQEQLDSYCKQTILPDELVIVDDCSTDSTQKIINNFKEKAPFKTIIIRNEENIGSTKSFEKR